MEGIDLESIADELLEGEYELDTAVDSRIPSMEWWQDQGRYSLKVYSDEFLENDSRAVGGKTLERVVKSQASEQGDFYVSVGIPSDSFTPNREVYAFSSGELEEGIYDLVFEYVENS